MIKSNKNKKKKGFTLVELIAVIAIIGILAAILVPTINGYLTKARKSKVVEQARQFAMACETVKAEGKYAVIDDTKLTDVAGVDAFKEIIPNGATDLKLVGPMTYGESIKITAGDTDFEIDATTHAFTKTK